MAGKVARSLVQSFIEHAADAKKHEDWHKRGVILCARDFDRSTKDNCERTTGAPAAFTLSNRARFRNLAAEEEKAAVCLMLRLPFLAGKAAQVRAVRKIPTCTTTPMRAGRDRLGRSTT